MMKNKQATIAMEKYIRIHEEIKTQERESIADDPDGIGCGADAYLFEELAQARDEFCRSVTPSDYAEMLKQVAMHRDNTCNLILENIVLKAEIKRLGGDVNFLGNVDSEGKA
ncbi:hypothetical protein ILU99_003823 [Salmonella enterica]|nr:hypothetical protein [Salmonella enterica]ECD8846256.1 hypothetical protein [Salmonella enterica subsp. enterica]ECV4977934.1 hypothetical protein [Salmonella enterica subsp. enterica serovar Praha]EHF1445921.1 hypothetical protein [Salmonella enterica subsp. enterica serovar 4,5,12:b:-]EHG1526888.1 hypothetical protein [Salmonella enterica subsp. enterica serovar 4,[5],12:b:-]EHJ5010538.1 hypothetical protein [Salmonella enterica subsp. enterica serovar Saintpaul]